MRTSQEGWEYNSVMELLPITHTDLVWRQSLYNPGWTQTCWGCKWLCTSDPYVSILLVMGLQVCVTTLFMWCWGLNTGLHVWWAYINWTTAPYPWFLNVKIFKDLLANKDTSTSFLFSCSHYIFHLTFFSLAATIDQGRKKGYNPNSYN